MRDNNSTNIVVQQILFTRQQNVKGTTQTLTYAMDATEANSKIKNKLVRGRKGQRQRFIYNAEFMSCDRSTRKGIDLVNSMLKQGLKTGLILTER